MDDGSGRTRLARPALGALVWLAGGAALYVLDGQVDLANLALLLVLTSALAALWWPPLAAVGTNALAVLLFNWSFVPPRGSFTVDLRQHALLLLAMLLVNVIVAGLLAGQRRLLERARRLAARSAELRDWGEALRDSADPRTQALALHGRLAAWAAAPVALFVLQDELPASDDDDRVLQTGAPDAEQRAGLWFCLRRGRAMGPGTGWHDELATWILPLRGGGETLGAALAGARREDELRAHLQALCDLMGQALQRARAQRDEQRARDEAQAQGVRNALLAAISHDYRTPLTTILSAASSLDEQAGRLGLEQRRRLARTIVDEVGGLARLTDNTLQLARLEAPGVALRCDWESAEEIVGAALRRARSRHAQRRLQARLEPGLPLLWCDTLLLAQLLDNLVDNALKYSPAEAPVEILARRQGEQAMLAVRDRGPGVPPAWRARIFDAFQRGSGDEATPDARRGAGIGLAVCQAIARAHGGELVLRPRTHGGSAFECRLPLREVPAAPREGAA
ncbi:MAG: DUF4118 domain-containing protein [Piscinibacter sp.]|nr:DUF4118 domain-containing protein [Piscinibacter sp.]